MKVEIIIPLIGVLLGWFLNEISQAIRQSRENKPFLAQAIGSICCILFILERKRNYLNSAIYAGKLSEHGHEFLNSILQNKENEIRTIREKSVSAVSNLDKFEPFISHELDFFMLYALDLDEKIQNKLHNIETNLEEIQRLVRELNIAIKKFHFIIKKLTLKHSVSMYFKYRCEARKNNSDKIDSFVEVFQQI